MTFREELHRRSTDGRWQAGASLAAGTAGGAVALRSDKSAHHLTEAARLKADAVTSDGKVKHYDQLHADAKFRPTTLRPAKNKPSPFFGTPVKNVRLEDSRYAFPLPKGKEAPVKLPKFDSEILYPGKGVYNDFKRSQHLEWSKKAHETRARSARVNAARHELAAAGGRTAKTSAAIIAGAGVAGAGAALLNHHRKEKSMENVGKSDSWREELHRRAHDGRFQAGAAAAAGAGGAVAATGLAGIAANPHKRKAAESLARRERALDQGYKASKDGKPLTAGHWLSAAHRRSADAEGALQHAGAITRRGKYAAIAAGGAGALAAAGLAVNHHKRQRMVNELEDTASLSKSYPEGVSKMSSYNVDLLFAAARDEEIQKNLLTSALEGAGAVGGKTKSFAANVTPHVYPHIDRASASIKNGASAVQGAGASAAKTVGAKTGDAAFRRGARKAGVLAAKNPYKTAGIAAGGATAAGGAGYAAGRRND